MWMSLGFTLINFQPGQEEQKHFLNPFLESQSEIELLQIADAWTLVWQYCT